MDDVGRVDLGGYGPVTITWSPTTEQPPRAATCPAKSREPRAAGTSAGTWCVPSDRGAPGPGLSPLTGPAAPQPAWLVGEGSIRRRQGTEPGLGGRAKAGMRSRLPPR